MSVRPWVGLWVVVFFAVAGCKGTKGPRTETDRIDDHEIESQVNQVLARTSGVDRMRITVSCVRGTVTLSGTVPSDDSARRAVEAAESVDGVEKVLDSLKRER